MAATSERVPVPPGTICPLCGHLAEIGIKDQNGEVHYFCEHDLPEEYQSADVSEHQSH